MISPNEMQSIWEELNRRVKEIELKYEEEYTNLIVGRFEDTVENRLANFLMAKPELLEEPDSDRYLVACYMARQIVLNRKYPESGGPAVEGGIGTGGFDDSEFEGANLPMPEAKSIEFVREDSEEKP